MNPQPRRTQYPHQTARPQDSQKKARKVTRLEGFDYSSESAYFVTLVTKNRERLFGEIINDEMVLSDFGRIVTEEWVRSAGIRKEIELGEFVIMPNHFHGIVHIFNDTHSTGDRPNSSPSNVGAYGLYAPTGNRDVSVPITISGRNGAGFQICGDDTH